MLEKNLYKLVEKYHILMNVDERDKVKFKKILDWTSDMFDLTIREKYACNFKPERGEIWTCNFGENVGSEVNKIRPTLIISSNKGNKNSPTVLGVPITSKLASQNTHVPVNTQDMEYVESELNGIIITEGIRCISKARLGRRIGKLKEDSLKRVEKAISYALGLNEQMSENISEKPIAI